MKTLQRGFTVIELLVVVTVVAAASILFFVQKNNLETANRDEQRKISINAMHYSLEEVYYKENGFYPRTLSSDVLPSVDPALFKDPAGVTIGEAASDFRYEPSRCDGDKCQTYTLRTTLENEADFIKENRDR
jgi:prepilin-type N-terminal cleavage/methylation domain-containing protein